MNRIINHSRCFVAVFLIGDSRKPITPDTEPEMIYRPNFSVSRRPRIAAPVFGWALVVYLAWGAGAGLAQEQVAEGSSSKQFRRQTVQSLPYQELNQQTKEKISDILNKPSIYRRLPVTTIDTDPDYFRFLVRYPEVIVNIWQLMGITQMTTERIGPFEITTNDGAGTLSQLELLYGSDNLHLFYGTGSYEGPVLRRKLTGKCVLVLRTEDRVGANGKPTITSQLDVFLKIENATAGLIAKTIQPLVGSTADHNFVESLKFVQRLNETTEKNGPGVQQMGERLEISADVQQKFSRVVDVVFQRAINATVPVDRRIGAPAMSLETNYAPAVQSGSSLARPPYQRTNQPRNTSGPAFENLRDTGYQPSPYGAQRAPLPAQHPQSGVPATGYGYTLPAQGYQQPNYSNQRYVYPNAAQPVQARYDSNGQPAQTVQPVGWQPR